MNIKTKILTSKDILKLINYQDVLEIVEKGYAGMARGTIINPPKTSVELPIEHPEDINWINSMPAYLVEDKIVGVKWINVTSDNKKINLPLTMGVILLNDAVTGKLLCMMDDSWLTYARTGASIALGVKYLGKQKFKKTALIGAGDNAKTALIMLSLVYGSIHINLKSKYKEEEIALVKNFSSKNIQFTICDTIESAVSDAEIIILSTTANEPLVKAEWGKKGDLLCTISGLRDLDPQFLETVDHVIFDSKKSGLKRIEQLTGISIDPTKSKMDLCELVLQKKSIRSSQDDTILYMPVGLAGVDILLAWEVFKRSNKEKIGNTISLLETEDLDFNHI